MLDTNTLDYIYDNKINLVSKLRNLAKKHIHLYITHIQQDERQKMIRPNCHPTYNERHEKIIEMIDWTLEKYKSYMDKTQQQNDEAIIIDNIIEELDKKRDIAITKKKQALLKDEVWKYGGEEDTIDYVLFRIREVTGRLV